MYTLYPPTPSLTLYHCRPTTHSSPAPCFLPPTLRVTSVADRPQPSRFIPIANPRSPQPARPPSSALNDVTGCPTARSAKFISRGSDKICICIYICVYTCNGILITPMIIGVSHTPHSLPNSRRSSSFPFSSHAFFSNAISISFSLSTSSRSTVSPLVANLISTKESLPNIKQSRSPVGNYVGILSFASATLIWDFRKTCRFGRC